jgi:hypothetical protein
MCWISCLAPEYSKLARHFLSRTVSFLFKMRHNFMFVKLAECLIFHAKDRRARTTNCAALRRELEATNGATALYAN